MLSVFSKRLLMAKTQWRRAMYFRPKSSDMNEMSVVYFRLHSSSSMSVFPSLLSCWNTQELLNFFSRLYLHAIHHGTFHRKFWTENASLAIRTRLSVVVRWLPRSEMMDNLFLNNNIVKYIPGFAYTVVLEQSFVSSLPPKSIRCLGRKRGGIWTENEYREFFRPLDDNGTAASWWRYLNTLKR